MANKENLIEYIRANTKILNIQVNIVGWPGLLKLQMYDIYMQICLNGKIYEGRGTDSDSNTAISKSFVEAFERYFVTFKKWNNTNGVAGHYLEEQSRTNARQELIERHIFLSNFFSQKKFPTELALGKSENSTKVISYLHEKGISCFQSVIDMKSGDVFCLITISGSNAKDPFGIIIGTAVSQDTQTASEKALIEAFRFYWHFEKTMSCTPISESDFAKIINPSLLDHGRLGLNIDYGNWFQANLLDFRGKSSWLDLEMPVHYDTEDISQSIPGGPPIFISRAIGRNYLSIDKLDRMYVAAGKALGQNFSNNKPPPFR